MRVDRETLALGVLAALISPLSSVTRPMELATSVMVAPAWSARTIPWSTRSTLASMERFSFPMSVGRWR